MSNKHKFLTILLCLALSCVLVFSLVACDPSKDDTTDVVDSGKIIANGNFELTSTTDYPKSPSSWKGAPGSSSGDNATDTDAKNLVSGVIGIDNATYNKHKRAWDKPTNPGKTSKVEADDNILMIYNKKNNAYRYTSNDFTLESNKYFKISVDVKTDKIEGAGAYVGIGGDAYEYINVGKTNDMWITVTFYFQSSNLNSNSINVVLGNGTKGKSDGSLSKGYAFFDNVIASEVEFDEYNSITEDPTNNVYKNDLRVSDGEFENVSLTGSNEYTPNLWSGVSTSAPTSTDSLIKGIVNLNESRPEYIPAGINPIGSDGKILSINNKKRTAYGYRSSKRLRIETSKYYKLTVNIATFIDSKDLSTGSTPNSPGAGAYLRLKSGTGAEDIVQGSSITGINTEGGFKEVSLYVKGDTMRNKDFYIELGLGLGEKDDPLLVSGLALFDSLTLSELTDDAYANVVEDALNVKVSVDKGNLDNTIKEANTDPVGFFEHDKVAYLDSNITYKGETIVARSTSNWDTAWGENPLTPNDSITSVTELKNSQPTANIYKFNSSKYQTINANGYYRLGMWVKTKDVLKDKGASFALYSYDTKKQSEQPNLEEKDLVTKLSSIDNINTLNIKNHITASYKDYVELAFYIEGDLLKEKDIYLQISLGSGTFLESSKHVKGTAYIADVTFYPITYTDYNAAEATTYLKKYSFKTTNASIQNGDFDDVNKQSTLNVYGKENKDFALKYTNGYLDNAFGVPSNWTQSDEAYLRSSLNAGIMNIKSATLKAEINKTLSDDKQLGFGNEFYNGFEKEFGAGKITDENNGNVLVVNTKKASGDYVLTESTRPEVCGCTSKKCVDQKFCTGKDCDSDKTCAHKNYNGLVKPWGYTSPSISLSADKYYMISVWAYVVEGKATISLKSSSKDQTKKFNIDATNGWQRFDFFVETGFDSTSANLELFLGDTDNNDVLYNGTVFFDMPRYTTISQDEYDQAAKDLANEEIKQNYNMTSYTVMTFDNVTSNTDNLDSAVGWDGAHRDTEAPAEDKDVVSGVYDIDHGNRMLFGKDDTRISEDVLNSIFSEANSKSLVINNNIATEYAYNYKLSKSLTKESYYMISVDVLTYGLNKDTTANITLKLEGTSYSFSKNSENKSFVNSEFSVDGTATSRNWRTYYFYLSTPKTLSIDNTTIILGLGNKDKDNYAQGYAFFDNVNVKKITETEFPDENKPEGTTPDNDHKYDKSISHRIVFTDADVEKPEPTEPDKTSPYLWLYISSGIIGGLIVIVVAYYLGKKLFTKYHISHPKKNKTDKHKNSYDRNRTPSSKTLDDQKSKNKFKD